MCGIAGIVRFAGLRPEERRLGAVMAETLDHRGPDDAGLYVDDWASLGHRRLSIIDLAGGRQPVANEDGTIQVVFNGEIYNFGVLADELRARGHVLKSRCDTEILVHLYEECGEAFVERLNGMFTIGLWDAREHKLILVRDRLGIKPLYWADDGRRIVFGSELKAILAVPGVGRRIEPRALCDYLTFGHVSGSYTIFDGIRKLEPGCMAICQAGGSLVRQWWDIPFGDPKSGQVDGLTAGNGEKWADAFAELLEDAVRMRLIADVPVGAFLSSGVDSAAVAAAMCRVSKDPVLTHTVGFEDRLHDERGPARMVAKRLGTDHREVMVRPDAAWAAVALNRYFDEPFADSSAVPTFYLSRATRERVKVALAGDGGDEMLAGYRRYRFDLAESAVRARCPVWLRHTVLGLAGGIYPKADWLPRPLRAKRTLQNLACDEVTAHQRSVSLAAGTLPGLLLRQEVLDAAGGYEPFDRGRDLYGRCGAGDKLDRLLYLDMKTLLPDDMLTKVDRASMAVGLEVRVPLLDYRIVELCAGMPRSLKLAGGRGKVVLRQVVGGWLGSDVADRPKKGFDVPVDAWFRGPLRDLVYGALDCPAAVCREWIDPRATSRILRDHDRGLRNNGAILWTLLTLELWAQAYVVEPVSQQNSEAKDNCDLVEVSV